MADLNNCPNNRATRDSVNPQILWENFKKDITKLAKETSKTTFHKLNSHIKKIEKDLLSIFASPDFDANEDVSANTAFLANELEHLEKVKARNQRNKLHANLVNHREKIGGSWSALSKERKPRDIIHRLKVPDSNPPQYEHCSTYGRTC